VQVADVEVGVLAGDDLGLGVGQVVDALVGLDVVLDPELLAARVVGPTDWENSSLGAGMPASVVVTGRSSVMMVLLLFAACGPSIWLTLPGGHGLPRPAR
jgi:hypothetical protein